MLKLTLLALCLAFVAGRVPHVPRLTGVLPRLPRIAGGVEAAPGEFPHQISVQKNGLIGLSHICGGSIISENYVVTACNCIDGKDFNKIFVVAGEHDLSVDSGNEQTIMSMELIEHEHYDGATSTNDIGLIKLSTPLNFNEFVKAIALPAQMELVSPGTNCTTTGWGATFEDGPIPDILRKVSVPVVSDADCRVSYGMTVIADNMLCAGLPEGGKDTCEDDDGGPFVCNNLLHGITSWGFGCGRPDYPGVYTEVAYFRDWIDSHAV